VGKGKAYVQYRARLAVLKNGGVLMRFIAHISLPAQKFNEVLRDGSAGKKIGKILEDTKPEAAYFTSKNGTRGGYVVYNIAHASDIPRYAEPWFLTFEALVEFMPCMIPEDLQKAGLEEIAKKWG
jgi:hypothetical protein